MVCTACPAILIQQWREILYHLCLILLYLHVKGVYLNRKNVKITDRSVTVVVSCHTFFSCTSYCFLFPSIQFLYFIEERYMRDKSSFMWKVRLCEAMSGTGLTWGIERTAWTGFPQGTFRERKEERAILITGRNLMSLYTRCSYYKQIYSALVAMTAHSPIQSQRIQTYTYFV